MKSLQFIVATLLLGTLGGGEVARAAELLDLNRATRAEILALPVPAEIAEGIWHQREYVDFYDEFLDLMEVDGMTPEHLATLRESVRILKMPVDPEDQRKNDLFYRFEWWEGGEGSDESLIELYKDLALDPVNVNRATIVDLQNLQNMSPLDAVAIKKHRDQTGEIGSRGALRRASGLSGWGYSNARHFLIYEDPATERKLHGGWSLRLDSSPMFDDVEELLRTDRDPGQGTNDNWWDRLELDNPSPAVYQKLKVRHGRQAHAGLTTVRRLGDEAVFDTRKGYLGVHDVQLGPATLDKVYVGNYMVSWGLGVVMEGGDFRSSRKTGFNFGKRYDGVLGDLSRTDQFSMRGIAAEGRWGPFRAIGFYSDDNRDAILNDDGSVNLLVRLSPRIENDDLQAGGLRAIRDQLHEQTWGGSLRLSLGDGRYLGVSGYESRYDRFFDPKWDPNHPTDKNPLIADDNEDVIVPQDNEYFSSYKSPGKYRRVYGLDFQWTYENLALQAEYGVLDMGNPVWKVGENPSALVLNAFLQYENFNVLTVYRDYDLDFDNPYQRSYSNYERFKGTIIEDYFRLEDPLYGFAYTNSAQPQAERGVYMESRYRVSEQTILGIQHDTWRRQGDMSQYYRTVARLEHRLLFPLRFKMRHKWQNREWENFRDPSIFENLETRFELEYRLSRFNHFELFFGVSSTQWPPRGRLQGEALANGLNPVSGNNALPAEAWGVWYTHHFESRRTKLDGSLMVYDGFLWFFEKNTFRVTDGRGFRWFVEATERVTDGLTMRFRYGRENFERNTAIDLRQFNEEILEEIDADNVKETRSWFRMQMDYTF